MSVGMPQAIWLNKFGIIVSDYFGQTAYQVGSSLETKGFRDVDVRLILPDDQYDREFGRAVGQTNPKLAAVTLAFSALGMQMTGLPIDFQVQRASHAEDMYSTRPRSALIEIRPVTEHALS